MQVGIVGAGYSGLITARILRAVGVDVVVHEAAPDVGGVWSRTRQYPGLTTQNDKVTYAVSDFPMPASYPTYPSGPQVGAYLEQYVDAFGLHPALRLNSEVVRAEPTVGGGWSLTTRDETGSTASQHVDHLVVANGVYCEPHIPHWSGRDEFEAAGGQVHPPSGIPDSDVAHGRDVVVVGYGKSACDISVPLSDVASSLTVVTRELLWKMPKRIEDRFEYKYALFTRLGENLLFRYLRLRGVARFLHGTADPLRRRVVAAIQESATKQLGLRALDLEPSRPFAETGPGRGSLVSDGFLERVTNGSIEVVHNDSVLALGATHGRPCVHLAGGRTVHADLVVAGTGFEQRVPFLPPTVTAKLTDERGAFRLFRTVLPVGVPDLSFIGYNQSLLSSLSAEAAALWLASLLTGQYTLPSLADRDTEIDERLMWSEAITEGHDSSGANIATSTMHNVDELLDDINLNLGPLTRARQWIIPVSPVEYRSLLPRLRSRVAAIRESHQRP